MNEEIKIPTPEELAAMRAALEAREAAKNKNKEADLGVAEKSQTESEKKQEAKSEVDWDKSAMIGAESGDFRLGEVDMDKSSVITAEAGGLKMETGKEQEITPEQPGASERASIELTEVVEEPRREIKESEAEAALAEAREEYVAAEQAMAKAGKEEEKLTGLQAKIKEFFVAGFSSYETDKTRIPERQAKIGGVQAEAQEAKEKLAQNRKAYGEALKNYRQLELTGKEEELKKSGKSAEEIKVEMEKISEQIARFTTLGEFTKIEDLKMDKQIEQMGKWRRNINESTERFSNWYKELPLKYKFAVSGALFVAGGGLGVVGLASTAAVVSFATAGQLGLRVIGGSMTSAGLERLLRNIEEKEETKSLSKEFSGKFLETLKNQNDQLDERLFKMVENQQTRKNIRFAVAGVAGAVVGSGALAQMFKGIFSAQSVEGVKGAKGPAVTGAEKPSGVSGVDAGGSKGPGAVGVEGAVVEAGGVAKGVQEIISLPIGARGPEGAIIDNFRAKPELAKSFGWDGKADISKWAGTKAHQLWLASVEGELAKPGMAAKLTSQGFSADAEGYAKAMHKIGQGFSVELDPQGHMHLSDNTSFLKARVPALEELGGAEAAPEPPTPPVETPAAPSAEVPPASPLSSSAVVPTPEELVNKNIKDTVTRLVEPGILTDKTFKAAAKIPLGKILEELKEVPPEVYKDKYALSNYWHSLSGIGVKTPDLPGTGFLGDLSYDDFRKYAEMTKFLRENPVLKSAAGLKNMTVEEFLKMYGGDLGKK